MDITRLEGRHSLDMGDKVNADGQRNIQALLTKFGCGTLPANWCWDWNINKHVKYRGQLTKRIGRWCKENCDIKLSKEQREKIGSIASLHRSTDEVYYFDFDRKLDWKAGDFADSGSCFFTGKDPTNEKNKALRDKGWIAMRFFEDNKYKIGKGRLLVWPYKDLLVVINGYYKTANMPRGGVDYQQTSRLAGLLANWLEVRSKAISIPYDPRPLYCHASALVGPPEAIETVNTIDINR